MLVKQAPEALTAPFRNKLFVVLHFRRPDMLTKSKHENYAFSCNDEVADVTNELVVMVECQWLFVMCSVK